ncbi:MAG: lipocalin-like domain-containing protein [Tannerella sp.]|nr:lipocalin-like domain-containing protein [Tannerella sp.]
MKTKGFWIIVVCVCILSTLTACQKELSWQLQGKWQLKTIEQSGHVSNVDTVWYNFQSKALFMYQIYHTDKDSFSHMYGYKSQPEENKIHLELTSYPRPVSEFLPLTDWEDRSRTFTVEKISSKRLVLYSDNKTYEFIRF